MDIAVLSHQSAAPPGRSGRVVLYADVSSNIKAVTPSSTVTLSLLGHAHAIADVTSLQATLDGKSAVGHTHPESDITSLVADLAGKATSVHTHAIADTQFTATQRLVARNSLGAGGGEEVTVSAVLDWLGSSRGMVLYRGTSWAALAAGTSGQFLKTAGAGADPAWANIAEGDVTNLTADLAGKAASSHTHAIANIQFASTQHLVGRNSASGGDGEELSVHTVLNWISTTRGSVMYRANATWEALSPGTAGQYLRSAGAAADPTWQAPTIGEVTGLTSALANKSDVGHSHPESDITSLVSDLAGKAATSHTHDASDLTAGTVATARLGSGTADGTSFLRGDSTYVKTMSTIVKAADQSKTSNTTIAADSALTVAVSASKTYRIRFFINGTFAGLAGFKYRITGPASPTVVHWRHSIISASLSNTVTWATAFDSSDRAFTTAVEPFFIEVEMLLQNGANAGNVALQWAQNSSSLSATTVYKGSILEYLQID